MNDSVQKLIALAKKEIGVIEDRGRNNQGKRIVEYQGATWLQPGAWPWCAAFTCWLMREWLEDDEVRNELKDHFRRPGFTLAQAEKVRCRDASAFGWEKWAKSWDLKLLPESELARAGDFVVFDFSHIGLVIENQKTLKSKIKTIEGNTDKPGSIRKASDVHQRDGDGVWEKERSPQLTKSYIRIFV